MSFIRKHAGKFLIGSLAFLGLVTWLNWSTTYESPLYGEVQVYRSEHGLYMYVEEIEIFKNTGKSEGYIQRIRQIKRKNLLKTVTFDKDELYYENSGDMGIKQYGRLYARLRNRHG